MERQAADLEKRNDLKIPINRAMDLISARIGDGEAIREYAGYELSQDILPWIDQTCRTLERLFASESNSKEFAERVGFPALFNGDVVPSADALAGRLAGGLHYLRDINEELYLSQNSAAVEAKQKVPPVGERVFIGHGDSPIW
ncbi:MAG TPA: hypothetical protein VGL72_28915, partial [Bryobacteraceae bacterium]